MNYSFQIVFSSFSEFHKDHRNEQRKYYSIFVFLGEYCESKGLSKTSGNCSEGYYCLGGASEFMPASIGKYSVQCQFGMN